MRRRPIAVLVVLIGLLATACGGDDDREPTSAAGQEQPPIRVGAIFNMTGPNSTLGQEELRGVEGAVADVNRRGGVLGRRIELVKADAASDPSRVATGGGGDHRDRRGRAVLRGGLTVDGAARRFRRVE